MRRLLLGAILLAGCTSPSASGIKVIAGAKLEPGPGKAPIDYSVVIVSDGKFQAVGPQSSTPVPPGVEMIRGNGMIIEPLPGGGPIEAGQPANLVLKGQTDRVMRNGEWTP
jgi:hypothetical protein